jgi:hypothetical protein
MVPLTVKPGEWVSFRDYDRCKLRFCVNMSDDLMLYEH